MNERIKELAEQATSRPHRSQGFGGEPTHIYPGTLDPEKFAELIVRECKSVLLDMMDESQGDGDTLDLALTEINEHFGVEE
jgi:hypothetical protein